MGRSSSTRILVVEDVTLEAKIIQRSLADVGYSNIVCVADETSALAELDKGARIVLTDIELADGSGISLAQKVRARAAAHYVYVIAMTGGSVAKRFGEAFEAGVDDFIPKPIGGAELRSRMRAAERIVGLETELRVKVNELETALRRIDVHAAQRALLRARECIEVPVGIEGGAPVDAVVASAVWRDAEEMVRKTLTDFFQLPCEACDAFDDDTFATEIELAEPNKQLKLLCNVTASEPLILSLAEHLMGEADLEAGRSLVLEIANMLMGGLKSSFLPLGYQFIGGLPVDVSPETLKASFGQTTRRRRLAFRFPNKHVVGVYLRTTETSSRQVSTKELVEGMVLRDDLHNEGGMLLVRGGTRLTQTAAERLARFAPNVLVTVIDNRSGGETAREAS